MSTDTLNTVERLLAPLRASRLRMLGVRDVMKFTGRRDRKCTRQLMLAHMGGFRDGKAIKVTIEALEGYLTRIYNPTPDDIARAALAGPRRTGNRKIAPSASQRKVKGALQ